MSRPFGFWPKFALFNYGFACCAMFVDFMEGSPRIVVSLPAWLTFGCWCAWNEITAEESHE